MFRSSNAIEMLRAFEALKRVALAAYIREKLHKKHENKIKQKRKKRLRQM